MNLIVLVDFNLYYALPVLLVVIVIVFFILRKQTKSRQRGNVMSAFTNSQFSSEDELAWYIAHDIMGKSGFDDCVVYKVDHKEKLCRQIAANGPKNPEKMSILNPINIPFGRGIVGYVAMFGKPEKVDDTTKDQRYMPDDDVRYSELCVPVVIDGLSVLVIDSEHRNMNYFTAADLKYVTDVAAIAAAKYPFS